MLILKPLKRFKNFNAKPKKKLNNPDLMYTKKLKSWEKHQKEEEENKEPRFKKLELKWPLKFFLKIKQVMKRNVNQNNLMHQETNIAKLFLKMHPI